MVASSKALKRFLKGQDLIDLTTNTRYPDPTVAELCDDHEYDVVPAMPPNGKVVRFFLQDRTSELWDVGEITLKSQQQLDGFLGPGRSLCGPPDYSRHTRSFDELQEYDSDGTEVIYKIEGDRVRNLQQVLAGRVRSRAAHTVTLQFEKLLGAKVTWVGHDIPLRRGELDLADIDTLLECKDRGVFIFVERKGNVVEDVSKLVEQVFRTAEVFSTSDYHVALEHRDYTIEKVVFAESISHVAVAKLKAAGISVVTEACGFFPRDGFEEGPLRVAESAIPGIPR